MKKILLGLILGSSILFFTTGCGKESIPASEVQKNARKEVEQSKETTKSKCRAVECIEKIEPENTVEQINEIIGFEGELTDEKTKTYTWKITNDESIIAKFTSGDKGTITVDYKKDSIVANKKVDLSKLTEVKKKVNAGISYDDFKKEVGDVDGVLIEKSEYSRKYVWANGKGGYVKATFNYRTDRCTFMIGRG